MPLCTIKMFKTELTPVQTADLIRRVTEAIIPFVGEKLREQTWVLVEEVANGSWGIGGRVIALKDVRTNQSRE